MADSNEMASIATSAKRKRKANFSAAELGVLVQKYEENKDILDSKLTNQVTNQMKKKQWLQITDAVNAVGNVHRDVIEIKEKWKCLKSEAKKSVAVEMREARKTGGGLPDINTVTCSSKFGSVTVRDKICDMFQNSSSFVGIDGGIETSPAVIAVSSPNIESSPKTSSSGNELTESDGLSTINTAQFRDMMEASAAYPSCMREAALPSLLSQASVAELTPQPDANLQTALPTELPGSSFITTGLCEATFRPTSKTPIIKSKISQQDIYQMQYRVLQAQEKNLELNNVKLQLQIQILKQKALNLSDLM